MKKARQYYGSETKKAIKNFPITNSNVSLRWIRAIAMVKIATTQANLAMGKLPTMIGKAIIHACEEIISGQLNAQFVTNSIQGGAGTSMHMNVNEVLAHRAEDLLDSREKIHPIDHVNISQSTNDVVPTALKIVLLELIDEYVEVVEKLANVCLNNSQRFEQVVKVGRTHLQDAVPISLGQEFKAYFSFFQRDIQRFVELKKILLYTNLGGTAVGTMINGSREFSQKSHHFLRDITGYSFVMADDLIDATQNIDSFVQVTQVLELSMLSISKIMNDLRLMASGPSGGLSEISLPEMQKGSSIMPGKVNPVAFEAVNQVAYLVSGAAQTGRLVLLNGQFELNVMLPVFGKQIIEAFEASINVLEKVCETLINIAPNSKHCHNLVEESMVYAPLLNEKLGYDRASKIVEKAVKDKKTLREVLTELHLEENFF